MNAVVLRRLCLRINAPARPLRTNSIRLFCHGCLRGVIKPVATATPPSAPVATATSPSECRVVEARKVHAKHCEWTAQSRAPVVLVCMGPPPPCWIARRHLRRNLADQPIPTAGSPSLQWLRDQEVAPLVPTAGSPSLQWLRDQEVAYPVATATSPSQWWHLQRQMLHTVAFMRLE